MTPIEQWSTTRGRRVRLADLAKDCECANHDGPHFLYSARQVASFNEMMRERESRDEYIMGELKRIKRLKKDLKRFGLDGTEITDIKDLLIPPSEEETVEQMDLFEWAAQVPGGISA